MKSWAPFVLAASLLVPAVSQAVLELPDVLSKTELEQEFSVFPSEPSSFGVTTSQRLKVVIQKSTLNEQMIVTLDDVVMYTWPTSTGRNEWETTPSGSYELTDTPSGTFRVRKMVKDYVSKTWKAKMPFAIFFNRGIAIHATSDVAELGQPASGGCVRLELANAETLWNLVRSVGTANTVITVEDLAPAY